MAQTKRRRRSKHRGTAAGTIESRGRTGRKAAAAQKARGSEPGRGRRPSRLDRPPTWRGALTRAALASGIFFAFVVVARGPRARGVHAADLRAARLLHRSLPVPAPPADEGGPGTGTGKALMDVRMFTVGPVAENCF